MSPPITSGFVAFALVVSGCAGESPPPVQATSPAGAAVAGADATGDGTLVHLGGRHGAPGSLWIQASYKVKRQAGKVSKTLAVEVENAPAGVKHGLSLDGVELPNLVTSSKGEAEVEIGAGNFPAGFDGPEDGSVLEIGELAEIRLLAVHKLTDLQVEIVGPGKLTGKVAYKVERLGDAVTTEFQVKVAQAGAKAVHPVRIDGVHVGDLIVEPGGKGKLSYSTLEGEPFPPGFQAPRAGSTIEVGQLYRGELRDDLLERAQ